jgi:ABC-type transport system involved in cytochrome bd biosynthesis fused ATPase/permease subunit
VVKRVDAAELLIVFAAVLAAAADAVLAAHHLQKLGAYLITALARLRVRDLAQRSSQEAGSTRENKGREERRHIRNSVWQFGTRNKKYRRRARV